MRLLCVGLLCGLLMTSAIPHALSEGRLLLAAGPSEGSPSCGKPFDKAALAGVPPKILAWGRVAHELTAAADCIRRDDIAKACAHWRKLMEISDEIGPPHNQNRIGIVTQMREHDCETVAASEPSPEPAELASESESDPGPASEPSLPPESNPVSE